MKEELQSKLVEILTAMQTAAGQAKDFALDQLPDIAQSYIVYGRVTSTLLLLMSMTVCGTAIYLVYRAFTSKEVDRSGDWVVPRVVTAMLGACAAVISGFISAFGIGPTMLVWFAPKVWLLKEIAGLIR
jgi:hypothetical protein